MIADRYCLLPRPVRAAGWFSPGHLTPAERRVLEHLCAGYSNKEIAATLGKAEPTVKHQVSSILHKAGLSSRARLIAALR